MPGEDSGDIPNPAAESAPGADPSTPSADALSADPDDPMGPPAEPCECWCMHCRRTFMSGAMWFQRILNDPRGFKGTWMCPTPNCDGAGFTIDIWPTDPEHPINKECVFYDDPDDDEEAGEFGEYDFLGDDGDWDPDETKWKELDELFGGDDGDGDDDLEGEEWKYGLQPGERPLATEWTDARFDHDDEAEDERRFDEPDRRPREVDWSDREDRRGEWSEDDIPF